MADSAVRIEIRGIANERDDAQRDLEQTLGALEARLVPARVAHRFVNEHGAALVLAGAAALGMTVGLVQGRRGAGAGLLAAAALGSFAWSLRSE